VHLVRHHGPRRHRIRLKVDEDIRIGEAALLVVDSHGINFLVRDMFTIDKHSRKILGRFL
jgi:hypothetical protein